MVILYTRQSLHTTTQLLQGSSEAGAKIWSFYTQDKAYTLQHSYFKALVKLEPKFGHFIQPHTTILGHWSFVYTRQSLHTTTQLLKALVKLEPKFGHFIHKAYTLQHSYSKALVQLEPKFGHNTAYTLQHSYTLLEPKAHRQSLHSWSEAGAKIWSFYTQDKAYTLQHSYSKALVKLEPKFGHFIHKTKPTHYHTATSGSSEAAKHFIHKTPTHYNTATPRL